MSVDESKKAMIAMQACTDSAQMDCIERVTVTHSDGSTKEATLTFGKMMSMDGMGAQRYENQVITLHYESERSGGAANTADIYVNLKTQWIDIPSGGIQVPGFNIMFLNVENISNTDIFTFSVRTSWLKPQNVALYAKNALFKKEIIPGGSRFILGGSKLTQAIFDDGSKYSLLYKPEGEFLKADRTMDVISLIVDHAAKYSKSAYPTECADYGYPVASSNASAAGQPKLKSPNEIEYAIAAPHFTPDGKVFEGYFQAELNTKYLNCVWPGNEISKSTEFSISIVDDKGVQQVATTSVGFKDNTISVRAYGFHYSAPTIKLEGNFGKVAPTPSASPSPTPTVDVTKPAVVSKNPISISKITITCFRGKLTKKVTAASPKCPVGYKKK